MDTLDEALYTPALALFLLFSTIVIVTGIMAASASNTISSNYYYSIEYLAIIGVIFSVEILILMPTIGETLSKSKNKVVATIGKTLQV